MFLLICNFELTIVIESIKTILKCSVNNFRIVEIFAGSSKTISDAWAENMLETQNFSLVINK